VNRSGRDTRRATFEGEELADLTLEFFRGNCTEGLLCSGVLGTLDETMERMIPAPARGAAGTALALSCRADPVKVLLHDVTPDRLPRAVSPGRGVLPAKSVAARERAPNSGSQPVSMAQSTPGHPCGATRSGGPCSGECHAARAEERLERIETAAGKAEGRKPEGVRPGVATERCDESPQKRDAEAPAEDATHGLPWSPNSHLLLGSTSGERGRDDPFQYLGQCLDPVRFGCDPAEAELPEA